MAKRHRGAIHQVQQALAAERSFGERCQAADSYLQKLCDLKDITIRALETERDGWREVAARHGVDVAGAPQRAN